MSRAFGLLVAALALDPLHRRSTDTGHRFGDGGEFAVERQAYDAHALSWRGDSVGVFRSRARALEAAADLARKRGDSAEDCGQLLAGVRW